jgi:hypothetical protein
MIFEWPTTLLLFLILKNDKLSIVTVDFGSYDYDCTLIDLQLFIVKCSTIDVKYIC